VLLIIKKLVHFFWNSNCVTLQELVPSIGGTTVTGEIRRIGGEACPSASFCTTNHTWIALDKLFRLVDLNVV
jgi:hypothetical protein